MPNQPARSLELYYTIPKGLHLHRHSSIPSIEQNPGGTPSFRSCAATNNSKFTMQDLGVTASAQSESNKKPWRGRRLVVGAVADAGPCPNSPVKSPLSSSPVKANRNTRKVWNVKPNLTGLVAVSSQPLSPIHGYLTLPYFRCLAFVGRERRNGNIGLSLFFRMRCCVCW